MDDSIRPEHAGSQRMSDQQAITLLKQGNIKGLESLVQKYQAKAVQAAVLITCQRELAEDVVQDSFLKVYRKIYQFDDSRPFSPWFFRIVINDAKKAVQRQKRTLPLETSEEDNTIAEWLIDPAKSPESLTETNETREQVWQAIRQLTPGQREAIVMRYFLASKESEMVRALGRPSTTVKWWLYAARKRLRSILGPGEKVKFGKKEVNHE